MHLLRDNEAALRNAVIEMPTRYVLIDYENVQPETLDRLDPRQYAVLVFVGANQTKILTTLAAALGRFQKRSGITQVSGNGPNSLDFHIAFYIGAISAQEPDALFYVVSKDTGFDPLIRHLKKGKITVHRIGSIDDISGKQPVRAKPAASATLVEIINDLKRRGDSRPRTVKALRATINARYQKRLTESALSALVDQLTKRGAVSVHGTRVSYSLPS